MNTQASAPPGGSNPKNPKPPKQKVLTLARIKKIERILEQADAEIDSIIQDYYVTPGGQNVVGNIVQISRLHAELVEQLAERKRELMQKGKK